MHHIRIEFEAEGSIPVGALRDFGFDEIFQGAFVEAARPGEVPGRVVEVQRDRYTVVVEDSSGNLRETVASATGTLLGRAAAAADYPTVGDWVLLAPRTETRPEARSTAPGGKDEEGLQLRSIMPRRSAFVRKGPGDTEHDRVEAQVLAANVDKAFIVMAAGRDWNPRRLERYLALSVEAGAEPSVIITKADLAEDGEALLEEATSVARGIPCVLVCAPEGRGLERVIELAEAGKTIVLLGSSGAGKSTLLNAIAGKELASTGEVRVDDQRGRHTTTHRQLYRLESGALVIDSPGLREIQLWAGKESVDAVFPEIEESAKRCRFRDCAHGDEPGCAVREALESGLIDSDRWASWKKLGRELEAQRIREDPEVRAAWRKTMKSRARAFRVRDSLRSASRGEA